MSNKEEQAEKQLDVRLAVADEDNVFEGEEEEDLAVVTAAAAAGEDEETEDELPEQDRSYDTDSTYYRRAAEQVVIEALQFLQSHDKNLFALLEQRYLLEGVEEYDTIAVVRKWIKFRRLLPVNAVSHRAGITVTGKTKIRPGTVMFFEIGTSWKEGDNGQEDRVERKGKAILAYMKEHYPKQLAKREYMITFLFYGGAPPPDILENQRKDEQEVQRFLKGRTAFVYCETTKLYGWKSELELDYVIKQKDEEIQQMAARNKMALQLARAGAPSQANIARLVQENEDEETLVDVVDLEGIMHLNPPDINALQTAGITVDYLVARASTGRDKLKTFLERKFQLSADGRDKIMDFLFPPQHGGVDSGREGSVGRRHKHTASVVTAPPPAGNTGRQRGRKIAN